MPVNTANLSAFHASCAVLTVLTAAMILPLSFTGGVASSMAINHELGAGPLALSWLTNGFMLTFGSSLLAAGVAADRLGSRSLFLQGLGLFFLSSVMLSLSGSTVLICLTRAVQGIAAAMALAGGTTALAKLFQGRTRIRVFSLLGTVFGFGLAFGPLMAGIVTEHYGWRYFWGVLSGLAALSALAGLAFLPHTVRRPDAGSDLRGLSLFSGSLMLLNLSVLFIPEKGLFSMPVLALMLLSFLSALLFILSSRRAEYPVFELSLLRNPQFSGVLVLPLATCCCYVVLLITLPLRFTGGEGFSQTTSALYMLALTMPVLILPSVSAWLTRWFSAGALSATGLSVSAIGLLLLAQALQQGSQTLLIGSLLLTGSGAALPWGLMDGLAVSGVPVEKSGTAAGLFNTVRVAGEGIVLVLTTAFLSELNRHLLAPVSGGLSDSTLAQAASWLAGGSLAQAERLLPQVSSQIIRTSYDNAYTALFNGLACLTLISAVVVWKALKRGGKGV